MWWALLWACGPVGCGRPLDTGRDFPDVAVYKDPCIVVTPEKIEFPETLAGETATETVTIATWCEADPGDGSLTGTLSLGAVSLADPTAPFEMSQLTAVMLPPLSSTEFEVTFRPTALGTWRTKLFIDSDDPDEPRKEVKLAATALGPVAQVSASSLELAGTAGCEAAGGLTVTNVGNGDLTLTAAMSDPAFTVMTTAESLTPTQAAAVRVAYAGDADATATLVLATNDATAPTIEVPVAATVTDTRVWHDETFALAKAKIDVVFAVDDSATLGPYLADLGDELTSFGDVIDGADLQIAVLSGADAVLLGETITDTADFGRLRAWLRLTSPDRGASLTQAVHLALADDLAASGGFHRAGATWVLVAVSDVDDDGGMFTIADEVGAFVAVKGGDASRFRYLALAGDTPTSPCAAEPGLGYAEAAALTDGWVGSICTSDWAGTLEALGEHTLGPATVALAHPAGSVTVEVDGVATSEWTYDAATQAVTLTSRPPGAASVRVRYAEPVVCP